MLGAPEDADLVEAVNEFRRRLDTLEGENSRLRAHLSASRYLSSESVRGTVEIAAAPPASSAPEPPHGTAPINLLQLLGCPDCRTHLGADGFVIEACTSVALDAGRPVSHVLTEYLELFHGRQHRTADRPSVPKR